MRKLALVVTCEALVACSGPSDSCSITDSDQEVAAEATLRPLFLTAIQQRGQVVYETICWTCHGTAGRGDGPAVQAEAIPAPPSFHTQKYGASPLVELERRFNALSERPDPTLPHMRYVTAILRPEHFREALSFIPALLYPPEIPGSALMGQRLYNLHCVGCHGPDGHGYGPASASLTQLRPVDFTTDALIAAQNWRGVFFRIFEGGRSVHGSSMPPWGIMLSAYDIWDLVAFLATFQSVVLGPPEWTVGTVD